MSTLTVGTAWRVQGRACPAQAPAAAPHTTVPCTPPRQLWRPCPRHTRHSSLSAASTAGAASSSSLNPARSAAADSTQQALPPSSSSSSSSSSNATPGGGPGSGVAANGACRVRPAESSDSWAVADLHACAFYPRSTPFWFSALRVDRVLSLQVGSERQQGTAKFMCLVAEGDVRRSGSSMEASSSSSSSSSIDISSSSSSSSEASSSSGGSSSSSGNGNGGSSQREKGPSPPPVGSSSTGGGGESGAGAPDLPAAAAAAAAAGKEVVRDFLSPVGLAADRVDLGPLAGCFISLFFPPGMRQNYAATYNAGGLSGAVVVDTLGDFMPPKRKRMPNGTVRDVPRTRIAYLSNLAVAPCMRRSGVGRKLVAEAEQLAAEWGCRTVALHVDPNNTAAVEMYRRAGYRRVADQPAWQRFLEGRARPLVLMMRVLPQGQRQLAQQRWEQAQQEEEEAQHAEQRRQSQQG